MTYPVFFQKILHNLNDSQRLAVDQIDGPVMVIAGPGTGKTHILAARIGKILLDTDTQPDNILCLTFTDAGVYAMRQRLVKMLGIDAYKIQIHTFHSFCNMVILEHPEKFGRVDMRPITDLERIEIIQEVLSKISADSPLVNKTGGKFANETQCRQLFQMMKSENWTADKVVSAIDTYINNLPSTPGYFYQRDNSSKGIKKGDPKTSDIEEKSRKLEKTKAAALLFDEYEETLRKNGLYEFQDMINWVSKAFKENEWLLRNYQERFLYFLVDEFQDTNGAQTDILKLLVDFWESPNVFIVGDDDQSIYEFQGARLENLASFYNTFQSDLKVIVLDYNYRSSQEILDSAGKLIEKNNLRAINKIGSGNLRKELTSGNKELAVIKGGIRLAQFEDEIQEIIGIKKRIKELLKTGVKHSEIAVIYAKNKDGEKLAASFKRDEIPFQTKKVEDALKYHPVAQLLKILHYIELETQHPFSGEHLLFEILNYEFFGLKPLDIHQWAIARQLETEKKHNFRTWLTHEDYLAKIDFKTREGFIRVSEILEQLMADRFNYPALQYIEKVMHKSGFILHGLKRPDKIFFMSAIKGFLQFVKEIPESDPDYILDVIEKMTKYQLIIPVFRISGQKDAVQLLTAHSAKGLEFDHVFMFNLTDKEWSRKGGGGSYRFSMPDNLVPQQEQDYLESRRRLFYVGMTRAKKGLNFSYSGEQRTSFVDEAILDSGIQAIPEIVFEEEMLAELETELLTSTVPILGENEQDLISNFLENWKMSASSLNEYLKCPVGFYYKVVLGVSTQTNESMTYGSAIHKALERYFRKFQNENLAEFPSAKILTDFFEEEMESKARFFSPQGFDVFSTMGIRNLDEYYTNSVNRWSKDFKVEYQIKETKFGEIPLTGTLDKIEIMPEENIVRIVDYKTSKADKSKINPPGEKMPFGGDYWRQMWFYKILFESFDSQKRKVSGAMIDYAGHQETQEFSHIDIYFDPAQEEQFLEILESAYQKITHQEFDQGCGQPHCEWCNFINPHD